MKTLKISKNRKKNSFRSIILKRLGKKSIPTKFQGFKKIHTLIKSNSLTDQMQLSIIPKMIQHLKPRRNSVIQLEHITIFLNEKKQNTMDKIIQTKVSFKISIIKLMNQVKKKKMIRLMKELRNVLVFKKTLYQKNKEKLTLNLNKKKMRKIKKIITKINKK